MVLVDTSVWIGLFRQKDTNLGQNIYRLVVADECAICGQIYLEFIGGFRKPEIRVKQAKAFAQYPILNTTTKDFILAADILAENPHLGSGDAIIAAVAIHTKSRLFTLDRDFEILKKYGLVLYS